MKWFLKDYYGPEDLGVLGSLLILTSSFEHEMGNVFHTHSKGTPVPHLLKDLLQYRGFVETFGVFQMFFVKFLLGNPRSINLRNIIWHGFPHSSQTPTEYLSTLILVIANFSRTLRKESFTIHRRPKIEAFRRIDFESRLDVAKFNWSSEYLIDTHKPIWEDIMRLFKREKFFEAAVLMLPQIELILRLIYKDLNEYDVSAKLDEYYITLDTIFENTVPGRSQNNQIFFAEETISNSSLAFLYDLFIAQNGLRLRDKIGHGEVVPKAVDEDTCKHLLFISNQLMSKEKFSFRSQFAKPCQVDFLLDVLMQNHSNLLNLNIGKDLTVISRISKMKEIEIFNRTDYEIEVTNRLFSILKHLDNIGMNLLESYSEKLKLLENRELRSRNRKTLKKMIELFPKFVHFYGLLISYSDRVFNVHISFERNLELKKVTQIVENFEKYSHKNCNEWVNILDLLDEFNKLF